MHTAQYAYSSDRSCMRTLPLYTAPTRAVCVSDLRIQLLIAVCVGMVHIIFSGSSKGTHTAPNEIFKLCYQVIQFMFSIYAPCCVHKSFSTHAIIPPAYEIYMIYNFRRFKHHICICLCIFVVLAHLSKRLICKVGYNGHLASVRPSVRLSTFSNGFFSETTVLI